MIGGRIPCATWGRSDLQPPQIPQATDCVYCLSYMMLFSSLLGISLTLGRAPYMLHKLNLVRSP